MLATSDQSVNKRALNMLLLGIYNNTCASPASIDLNDLCKRNRTPIEIIDLLKQENIISVNEAGVVEWKTHMPDQDMVNALMLNIEDTEIIDHMGDNFRTPVTPVSDEEVQEGFVVCDLEGCNNRFAPLAGKKFCSDNCRWTSYKRKKNGTSENFGKKVTCANRFCEKKFLYKGNKKYCSKNCNRKENHYRALDKEGKKVQRLEEKITKVCGSKACNKEFETYRPEKIYCSQSCGKNERDKQKRASKHNPSFAPESHLPRELKPEVRKVEDDQKEKRKFNIQNWFWGAYKETPEEKSYLWGLAKFKKQ